MVRWHAKIFRKVARPLYVPYYRWVFGRSFPGSEVLRGWVRRYEAISGRGDVPLSQDAWEEQYARGAWDFLREEDERSRYLAIGALLEEHVPPGGQVAALGCGEGLLLDYLPESSFHVLGVDLSEVAIEKARSRFGDGFGAEGRARFVAADAEAFEPDTTFHAIVLNECLYYFRHPLRQAERYFSYLSEGGVLLLSMFRTPRTDALARVLSGRLPLVDEREIAGEKGRWRVGVFRKL